MLKRTILLLIMLSLVLIQGEQLVQAAINTDDFSKTVDSLRKEYDVPGVAIGLIEDGKIVMTRGFGYRIKNPEKPVGEDTLFQVASMSKPVAALGVMSLVHQDIIELDDAVEEHLTSWHLPESEYDSSEVTIERLLSHYAGLGPGGYPGYPPDDELPTLKEALAGGHQGTRPVKFNKKPGSEFSYAGGGYTILQLMIEELSGMDFSHYMEHKILDPLEMNESFFTSPKKEDFNKLARPYSLYGGKLPNYLFIEKAAAGLYSTVTDYCKFIQANIAGYRGEGLLPEDVYEQMFTKVNEHYGLGWRVVELKDGERVIAHGGANYGWKSYTAFFPGRGDGIVILTNSDRGLPFYRDVANTWYEGKGLEYRTETPGLCMIFLIDLYQRIVRVF